MNMKIREYENTHMNNRANLYYHVLIQVNMMPILNVTNSLQWVQTQPRGSLKGKEHQRWTTPRECKDQWKVQNNYFKKSGGFIYKVEQSKLNTRNCSHVCWPCKHQLLLLSDSITSRKMGTLNPMVNCYKESLWFMTKCTDNIPDYQKKKQ